MLILASVVLMDIVLAGAYRGCTVVKVDQIVNVQHPTNPLLNVKLLCVAVHGGPRSVIDRYPIASSYCVLRLV